jgi:23S rRNA pseudouridine1911/1915/1917 synthase
MMHQEKEKIEFTVSESEVGSRLDVFLSQKDISASRSQIKRMINNGNVQVIGLTVKPGYRLKQGDIVVLHKEEPKACNVTPEDISLNVVYEDKSIIVLDKPSGMVVHPAAGNYTGTLVNALLFYCKDLSGIGGYLRPGIVHRLDKFTSGLIVVAKSDSAHAGLAKQFKDHLVKKNYKALVLGDIKGENGVVELPIGRHPKARKKMSVKSKRGKMSVTRWNVIERYGIATLLDVRIETGRTHQIRVHLSTLGYPVVGDSVYGNSKKRVNEIKNDAQRNVLKMIKRQALHASKIGFRHPVTDCYMEFSSPMPEDMASVCEALREYTSVQLETRSYV